jgi:hypothetical protein
MGRNSVVEMLGSSLDRKDMEKWWEVFVKLRVFRSGMRLKLVLMSASPFELCEG